MKKYKVLKAWEGVEVGEVLKTDEDGEIPYLVDVFPRHIPCHEVALLLHAGFIEEVKEVEWPKKEERYWFIDETGKVKNYLWFEDNHDRYIRDDGFGIFRTEKEAQEMFEYLKGKAKEKRA